MECVTCVCVWLGLGLEVFGVRGLGLGFTNPGGTWGKWDMCLCFFLVTVVWVAACARVCDGGVVLYLCVL